MPTTKEKLSQKKCQPCEDSEMPLRRVDFMLFLKDLPNWAVSGDDKVLFREFNMKNFVAGVELISRIAKIAEEEGHHPDIHLTNYRKLRVELTTHAIEGLSENDFIMASKIYGLSFEEKT